MLDLQSGQIQNEFQVKDVLTMHTKTALTLPTAYLTDSWDFRLKNRVISPELYFKNLGVGIVCVCVQV